METMHFTQLQLAKRWSVSEATLERWRSEGIGPVFLKLRGCVLYRQCDIEQYEESCLTLSTRRNVCAGQILRASQIDQIS